MKREFKSSASQINITTTPYIYECCIKLFQRHCLTPPNKTGEGFIIIVAEITEF